MILLKVRACDRIHRPSIIHIKQDETSAQEEPMSARINGDPKKTSKDLHVQNAVPQMSHSYMLRKGPRALLQVA